MPKTIVPLTDTKILKAKPAKKQRSLFDGGGLFLLIVPTGAKLWRFKYQLNGKSKMLSMGRYPEISLRDARQRREAAREQLAHGIDPAAARKAQKESEGRKDTFEAIAREWMTEINKNHKTRTREIILARLENDVFPYIGKTPIADIKAPDMLKVLRRIETRGIIESTHRTRSICGRIFRYAISTGRADRDVTADLRGAIQPVKTIHRAAITEPRKVGELLRAIDGYQGSFIVQCALKLAPLVFVRPGELRHAEWSEIDFENSMWNIPAGKMKMNNPHLVPLSKQAIEILLDIKKLTGRGRYVFPSGRSSNRAMSDNAILAALRRMGYDKEEMTGHGFRAMARTLLDEALNVRPDYIEHQLAHAVKDPLGRAYNRTQHLKERKKMMQMWADYLDGLKAGAKVIPFTKAIG